MRQNKKTLHLRLRGGGGDGGVYPLTHAEQKWMTPSEMGTSGGGCHSNAQKDRATEGTLRLDRSTVCAATAKPLKAPIVVCDLGYLLNKEDVIELMLSKALPPHLSHIKSLKGLHEATLHANPAHSSEAGHTQGRSEEDEEPPFYCPIATLPLNGRYPFVLIKPTGHVVSQRALKQVGGKVCPVTETKLSGDEAILQINPSEEERKEMQSQLEARKAAQAEAKKQKKQKGGGGGAEQQQQPAAAAASGSGSAADVGTYVYSGGDGEASAKAKGKEKAKASVAAPPPKSNGGGGGAPAAHAAAVDGKKRPRSEWEQAIEKRKDSNDVYKSLFLSKEDRKKQDEANSANFCARGIVPSVNHTGFRLG